MGIMEILGADGKLAGPVPESWLLPSRHIPNLPLKASMPWSKGLKGGIINVNSLRKSRSRWWLTASNTETARNAECSLAIVQCGSVVYERLVNSNCGSTECKNPRVVEETTVSVGDSCSVRKHGRPTYRTVERNCTGSLVDGLTSIWQSKRLEEVMREAKETGRWVLRSTIPII